MLHTLAEFKILIERLASLIPLLFNFAFLLYYTFYNESHEFCGFACSLRYVYYYGKERKEIKKKKIEK